MATIDDFVKLDIRVGKIIEVKDFPEAKKPTFKMLIDFGKEIGIKKSSGRYKSNYSKEKLINKLVLGVVNLPARQVGPTISEVLILGVPNENSDAVLVVPDESVNLGAKLY